jgi:hypothetical protein
MSCHPILNSIIKVFSILAIIILNVYVNNIMNNRVYCIGNILIIIIGYSEQQSYKSKK